MKQAKKIVPVPIHPFTPVDVVTLAHQLSNDLGELNPLQSQGRFENMCTWTVGLLYKIELTINNLQPPPSDPYEQIQKTKNSSHPYPYPFQKTRSQLQPNRQKRQRRPL